MSTRKRGLSIPWKYVILALIILLQLVFFIACIAILSNKFFFVYTILQILGIVIVLFILNKGGNPSFKINWIIFILLLPPFGSIFYLFYGTNIPLIYKKRAFKKIENRAKASLKSDISKFGTVDIPSNDAKRQSNFLLNTSGYPVYKDCQADYYSPGEKAFPRMLTELENAEKYIFIEFFILAQGEMWNKIHAILRKKALMGVDVRIIFDDFGSINKQYAGFVKGLRSEGIKVSVFNPIRPSVDLFMNNRNHRKILVVDGKVAMTGGINIADEYVNYISRFGYWMDCAIFITGGAAFSFAVMFLSMWSFITKKYVDYNLYRPESSALISGGSGYVQPYCDGPLNSQNPAKGIYLNIINNADKYVYITSPYLILDNEMMSALCMAAGAGVDVRIITPKMWDKWYVHPVTQSNYDELIRNGIRVYEYTPGFIHSKLFVCDDCIATVGSVNMDYRSFYFHFECGVWLYKNSAVYSVRNDICEIMSHCEEIKLNKWRKRPFIIKVKQFVLKMFAPFL